MELIQQLQAFTSTKEYDLLITIGLWMFGIVGGINACWWTMKKSWQATRASVRAAMATPGAIKGAYRWAKPLPVEPPLSDLAKAVIAAIGDPDAELVDSRWGAGVKFDDLIVDSKIVELQIPGELPRNLLVFLSESDTKAIYQVYLNTMARIREEEARDVATAVWDLTSLEHRTAPAIPVVEQCSTDELKGWIEKENGKCVGKAGRSYSP